MKRTVLVLAGLLVPGLAFAGETPMHEEEAAVEEAAADVEETGDETEAIAATTTEEMAADTEETVDESASAIEKSTETTVAKAEEGTEKAATDVEQAGEEAVAGAEQAGERAGEMTEEAATDVEQTGEEAVAEAEQAGEKAGEVTEEAAADVEQTGEEAVAEAEQAGEKAGEQAGQMKEEAVQETEEATGLALGETGEEQKVKGTILAIDMAQGTLELRADDPQKQRHTLYGTPAQLEEFEVGEETELSFNEFGENKWISGERGEIDVEGLAAAETVEGTVKSIDKNKGEVVLSEGEPGSFKAHPDALENLEPGQFVSLTYQKLGKQNWAEKIEQTEQRPQEARPEAQPGAVEEPVQPEAEQGVESPPGMERPGTETETEEQIFEDEVEVEPTEEEGLLE